MDTVWLVAWRMAMGVRETCGDSDDKTINLASETSVEEISNLFLEAWRLGLRSVAVNRDGSKRLPPIESETS